MISPYYLVPSQNTIQKILTNT